MAIVATMVETANPESELSEGLKLLGSVLQKFVSVDDVKVSLIISIVKRADVSFRHNFLLCLVIILYAINVTVVF